jgi:hypothetical protein
LNWINQSDQQIFKLNSRTTEGWGGGYGMSTKASPRHDVDAHPKVPAAIADVAGIAAVGIAEQRPDAVALRFAPLSMPYYQSEYCQQDEKPNPDSKAADEAALAYLPASPCS